MSSTGYAAALQSLAGHHADRARTRAESGDFPGALAHLRRAEAWDGLRDGLNRPARITPAPAQDPFKGLDDAAQGAALGRRGSGAVVWVLRGELLRVPDGFEASLRGAKAVEVEIRDGLGGDALAALEMLRLLDGVQDGNVLVTTRGRQGAASAHAVLASLAPGWRRIEAGSRLLLHRGHSAVIGDFEQLRAAAGRLERAEFSLALRIARRAGRPVRDALALVRAGDLVFGAEAAVRAGLADEVIPSGD